MEDFDQQNLEGVEIAQEYLRSLSSQPKKAEGKPDLEASTQPELLRQIGQFLDPSVPRESGIVLPDWRFSDQTLELIRRRGLKVAILGMKTVIDYLNIYGQEALVIEQAFKDKCPDYEREIFQKLSLPRQIAYDPYQIVVPGSKSLNQEAQEARMAEHVERIFGVSADIDLPWFSVCETLSFAELFFRLEERPLFGGWKNRTGDKLTEEGTRACLGTPNDKKDAEAGRLFVEYYRDDSNSDKIGALAIFQPTLHAKYDSRLDYWRHYLKD